MHRRNYLKFSLIGKLALSATPTFGKVEPYGTSGAPLLAKTIYAEAGNQHRTPIAVEEVARLINTRLNRSDYPDTLQGVIIDSGEFSSVGSNEWKKVENRELNPFEFNIFSSYHKIAKEVLEKNLQTSSVAFHDDSEAKPTSAYWDKLTFNKKIGDLLFYNK